MSREKGVAAHKLDSPVVTWAFHAKAGRLASTALLLLVAGAGLATARAQESGTGTARQEQPGRKGSGEPTAGAAIARGKKLILKDGTFQIVRSYQRNGDRVRYLSAERGAWEELPASLVDWEATAKAEAETEEQTKALVEAARRRDLADKQGMIDVDASLELAPGVFLPQGEGLYVVEGSEVRLLEQAEMQVKLDKGRTLEQVLSPVKVIPTRHRVEIPGAHAKLRLKTTQPEFYLRQAPHDPDQEAPVQTSSRPSESGPELELMAAKVKGGNRLVESISTDFIGQESSKKESISIQRWPIAPNVFRFTLSESLKPGEYALSEPLPEGLNLYIWEFGVDPGATSTAKPTPATPPPEKNH
jgi:hypothetical protein